MFTKIRTTFQRPTIDVTSCPPMMSETRAMRQPRQLSFAHPLLCLCQGPTAAFQTVPFEGVPFSLKWQPSGHCGSAAKIVEHGGKSFFRYCDRSEWVERSQTPLVEMHIVTVSLHMKNRLGIHLRHHLQPSAFGFFRAQVTESKTNAKDAFRYGADVRQLWPLKENLSFSKKHVEDAMISLVREEWKSSDEAWAAPKNRRTHH